MITVGDTHTLKLPSITDPDGDAFTVSIEYFSKIATFTMFIAAGKYVFKPTSIGQVGVYNVAVVLKD